MIKIKEIYEGWRNNLFPPEAMKESNCTSELQS